MLTSLGELLGSQVKWMVSAPTYLPLPEGAVLHFVSTATLYVCTTKAEPQS